MMVKKICFLTLFMLLVAVVIHAQRKTVAGFLRDSLTDFTIPEGTITNATTNVVVKTDNKGFFNLQVATGDFIYAVAKSYRYDTLNYSFIFTDTITIYLSPAGNILPNVTVSSQYNKYQLDSIRRKGDFEQLHGTPVKTLSRDHPSGFGLTFNLDPLFKSKYKNSKDREKRFNNTEKMAYVNYRFSPHLVAYYTRLKGEALSKFLNLYTPDYDWLRNNPGNEEVILYINDKLKDYRTKASK